MIVQKQVVGHSVDHGPDETLIAHAPFEFIGSGLRREHGEMGESGKAIGMCTNGVKEMVVDSRRQVDAIFAVQQIGARRRGRQDLQTYARSIHGRNPAFSGIGQQRFVAEPALRL
jgi:hypothetical protein